MRNITDRRTRAVFPGGALPTVTLLMNSLERATSGRLVVESISNIGPHYARTLREWRRRFVDNFAEIEQALRKDHPGVFDLKQGEQSAHELAVFRRKWLCKNPIYSLRSAAKLLLFTFFEQITCASVSFWENYKLRFTIVLVAIARSGLRRGY